MIIATRSLQLWYGERDIEVPIRIFAPETEGALGRADMKLIGRKERENSLRMVSMRCRRSIWP